MKRAFLIICFLIVSMGMSVYPTKADFPLTEVLDARLKDMWNDYGAFFEKQTAGDREVIAQRMERTARNYILTYFQQSNDPTENQKRITAEAFILLALVEYEVENPTLTSYALETAKKVSPGVVEKVDSLLGNPFKEKLDLIEQNWLPGFKKCDARVYGFSERNIIWDTLNVEIGVTYLERGLREDKTFQAIKGAEDYLNSELRNGKNEITLLLPPGMYRLKTENLDIYPARFEVGENSPPTIFDITPDRYFNLRVFFCKDTTETKIDTIFNQAQIDTTFLEDTSQVYQKRPKKYRNYLFAEVDTTFKIVKTITVETQRVPLSPKDMDIWKGDRRVLNFDHLAFGEYEFAVDDTLAVPSEYWFKRFLPEEQNWDMPKDERFVREEIFVRDKDTYNYCIDLPRKGIKPPPIKETNGDIKLPGPKRPEKIFFLTLMAATFYIFMQTVK